MVVWKAVQRGGFCYSAVQPKTKPFFQGADRLESPSGGEHICEICGFYITVKYKGHALCPNHIEAVKHMESGARDIVWIKLLSDREFMEWWTGRLGDVR